MQRNEIFDLINEHRDAQDRLWPRDLKANPQRAQYQFYAPHLLVLEEKVKKLRENWYKSDKEQLHKDFVSVATIAVRALEEVANAE
jgi:hypothetical protein